MGEFGHGFLIKTGVAFGDGFVNLMRDLPKARLSPYNADMRNLGISAALLFLLLSTGASNAQNIWNANLPGGQEYHVLMGSVVSISLQKYISRTLAVQDGSSILPVINAAQGNQKTMFLYAGVTEAVIETTSGIPARFYAVTPLKGDGAEISFLGTDITEEVEKKKEQLDNIQKSVLDVVNTDGTKDAKTGRAPAVIKDYPVTTHARNIEFRLANEAEVKRLYNSAYTYWKTGGAPSPNSSP